MRFIHNIAVQKHNLNKHIPFNDIMSAGVYGMIKAIKKYDVTKGFKLISYAVWWIRQSISGTIREYSDIRLGVKPKANVSKIRKFSNKFMNENFRKPNINEICDEFGLSVTDVMRNEEYSNIRMVSYDTPIKSDENLTLLDGLPNDSFEISQTQSDLNEDVKDVLGRIGNNRVKHIIEHSFGVNGKEKMSDKELGEYWNITHSRIDQIKKTALLKLKNKNNVINHPDIKKQKKKYENKKLYEGVIVKNFETDKETTEYVDGFYKINDNRNIVEKIKTSEKPFPKVNSIKKKPKKLINRFLSKFFKR